MKPLVFIFDSSYKQSVILDKMLDGREYYQLDLIDTVLDADDQKDLTNYVNAHSDELYVYIGRDNFDNRSEYEFVRNNFDIKSVIGAI